jgi:quercetin 2,3-dioxygenase
MHKLRRNEERGKAEHGWLSSRHTFSFAEYYDSQYTGFRSLLVINEDKVAPGKGFGTHPHKNMEIISYVVSGSIAHKDSMGNGRAILPGEFQFMSAGSGVTHSEFNPSATEPVHFLQIWINPNKQNLTPSYAEWKPKVQTSPLMLVGSPDASNDSALINQDVLLWLVNLTTGNSHTYTLNKSRSVWLQVVSGEIIIDDINLFSGDGIAYSNIDTVEIKASKDAKALLFDLA